MVEAIVIDLPYSVIQVSFCFARNLIALIVCCWMDDNPGIGSIGPKDMGDWCVRVFHIKFLPSTDQQLLLVGQGAF